jgi:hydroxyacylglutathione hydrolase
MPEPITRLIEGDKVPVLGLEFRVLDVPGHTAGHIAFFCDAAQPSPVLFCGDTLFSGGCGRLFEGTAVQMQHSLEQFAALPGSTRVCCAHEYTLSNLKFACAVEPDNQDLLQYTAHAKSLRAQGLPTLPSSIALELQINPFLRSNQPTIAASARAFDAIAAQRDGVFATLRQWKNQFP